MKEDLHIRISECVRSRAIRISVLLVGLGTVFAGSANAAPGIGAVVNAASYEATLAPGRWAAIFGTELAAGTGTASSVPLPLSIGGVSVTVGGVPAPLLFISPGQINALIPFDAPAGRNVAVVVTAASGATATAAVVIGRNAPAIFTQNSQGTGRALALDSLFRSIDRAGTDVIILYATGLGATDPALPSSASGGSTAEPFNRIKDSLQVWIGEAPATVTFAGLAPNLPGIYQVNVIPASRLSSNRLILAQNGVFSNSVTLPIPAGANTANVSGAIEGLYPASWLCAGAYFSLPAGQSTSGPVTISQMLTAVALNVKFDILPGAKPFQVVATTPAGNLTLDIDPENGTVRRSTPVPTAAARVFDFSLLATPVDDFLSRNRFPGNIVPLSRLDPVAFKAGQLLPYPNSFDSRDPVNATLLLSYALPVHGHFANRRRCVHGLQRRVRVWRVL